MNQNEHIEWNRQHWNAITPVNFKSDFYRMQAFQDGESSLDPLVLDALGEIRGKKILHLQCHFGQDSISMARMGASVTGVDFSEEAIRTAKQLAEAEGADAQFICCNIYDLEQHLNEKFDIVFTSYGVIGWLPDLEPWAKFIHRYLKKGGEFHLIEFHPVVWMLDNDFQFIQYSYFNVEPIIEDTSGSYADREAAVQTRCVGWNHSLREVLNPLLQTGLQIQSFDEVDYSPYACFQHTIEISPGRYQIENLQGKIPMVYLLKMSK